jgi:hypothetical protein
MFVFNTEKFERLFEKTEDLKEPRKIRVTFNIPITGRKERFFHLIAWRTRKGTTNERFGFFQRRLMRSEQIALSAESDIIIPLSGKL